MISIECIKGSKQADAALITIVKEKFEDWKDVKKWNFFRADEWGPFSVNEIDFQLIEDNGTRDVEYHFINTKDEDFFQLCSFNPYSDIVDGMKEKLDSFNIFIHQEIFYPEDSAPTYLEPILYIAKIEKVPERTVVIPAHEEVKLTTPEEMLSLGKVRDTLKSYTDIYDIEEITVFDSDDKAIYSGSYQEFIETSAEDEPIYTEYCRICNSICKKCILFKNNKLFIFI